MRGHIPPAASNIVRDNSIPSDVQAEEVSFPP
ncbi:TPA_asm: pathogenicity island 2 effector protein SseF, partial [Salmonella enterica subsp. houtenae serovar 45:g,z51:-]|nr:pathogenicity island 2 effector protein SseF [Salmonella enterica subsp. houtenae str. CFSAN000557]HAE7767137.1 pathogenicity island 2 effector protein SseF [Salmonella enterica subsp. houtenae serovar 45:g,z51:-]